MPRKRHSYFEGRGARWEPGYAVVVLARWPLGRRLLIAALVLAVFWGLGFALGTTFPLPWRVLNLVLDAACIFLLGTILGLVCIAANLLGIYFYFTVHAMHFEAGWAGPLLAITLGLVVGLMRNYVIQLYLVHVAASPNGMVAICSHCKRIRDDEGDWQQVDHYVEEHSALEFTHSICPICLEEEMHRFDRTGS